MGKYTRPPKEVLVEHIISLRIKKGYSTDSIIKFLMGEYKYGKYYCYVLYNKAIRIIEEHYELSKDTRHIESILLMENMLHQALENQDNKLSLLIIKELNRCNGLYSQDVQEDKQLNKHIIINYMGS